MLGLVLLNLMAMVSVVSIFMFCWHPHPLIDFSMIVDLPGRDIIKFGIESKHSCPSTSTQLFSDALTQSLIDLRELCLVPPRAHL